MQGETKEEINIIVSVSSCYSPEDIKQVVISCEEDGEYEGIELRA